MIISLIDSCALVRIPLVKLKKVTVLDSEVDIDIVWSS